MNIYESFREFRLQCRHISDPSNSMAACTKDNRRHTPCNQAHCPRLRKTPDPYIVNEEDIGKTSSNHPRFEPLGRVLGRDVGKMIKAYALASGDGYYYAVENDEQFQSRINSLDPNKTA